jgi:hypothetical protein
MYRNVVRKDVDDHGEEGEEEGDEGVDEDNEEESREDAALREASAQITGGRGVRVGAIHEKGAVRKEGSDPGDKIGGRAHGNEPSDKDFVRYSIKSLGNIKKEHGKCRGSGQGRRHVRNEPEEVVAGGEAWPESSLKRGEVVSSGDKVDKSVEDDALKKSSDDGGDVDEAVRGGRRTIEAMTFVKWKGFG